MPAPHRQRPWSGHAARHGTVRTYRGTSVRQWPHPHPCARIKWPGDAVRGVHKCLWVGIDGDVVCVAGRGLDDRAERTQQLMLDGMIEAAGLGSLPSFAAVRIGIHDAHCNETMLSYATFGYEGRACGARLIPHEHFGPRNGDPRLYNASSSFTSVTASLAPTAASHPEAERCGWAGGSRSDVAKDATHPRGLDRGSPARPRFASILRENPAEFEIVDTSQPLAKPLPLATQVAKWRCLADVKGAGYSGRVPALLHSNRTLLYVARPHLVNFFETGDLVPPLQPWSHYVPVRADMSDLTRKARWVLAHRLEADAIAARALAYARCHLSVQAARRHLTRVVIAAGTCAMGCSYPGYGNCFDCMVGSGGNFSRAFEAYEWVERGHARDEATEAACAAAHVVVTPPPDAA